MAIFIAEDFRSLLDKLNEVENLDTDKADTKSTAKPTTGNQSLVENKKIVKK